jgi:hypothetical protein
MMLNRSIRARLELSGFNHEGTKTRRTHEHLVQEKLFVLSCLRGLQPSITGNVASEHRKIVITMA